MTGLIVSDGLVKIVIVGNSHVGKSCLLLRYTDDVFTNQFYNTIGVDFKHRVIKLRDKTIKMQIWDTAGQERFKALTNNYYRDANGVVIVYDVTDKHSFEAIDKWMEDVEKYSTKSTCRLLIGNKADMSDKRKISKEDGLQKAKQYGASFLETSAKTANNVSQLFISLTELIMEQNANFHKNKNLNYSHDRSDNQQNQSKKGCC